MVSSWIKRQNETSRRSLITWEIQGYHWLRCLLPVIGDISDPPSKYLVNPRANKNKTHIIITLSALWSISRAKMENLAG